MKIVSNEAGDSNLKEIMSALEDRFLSKSMSDNTIILSTKGK